MSQQRTHLFGFLLPFFLTGVVLVLTAIPAASEAIGWIEKDWALGPIPNLWGEGSDGGGGGDNGGSEGGDYVPDECFGVLSAELGTFVDGDCEPYEDGGDDDGDDSDGGDDDSEEDDNDGGDDDGDDSDGGDDSGDNTGSSEEEAKEDEDDGIDFVLDGDIDVDVDLDLDLDLGGSIDATTMSPEELLALSPEKLAAVLWDIDDGKLCRLFATATPNQILALYAASRPRGLEKRIMGMEEVARKNCLLTLESDKLEAVLIGLSPDGLFAIFDELELPSVRALIAHLESYSLADLLRCSLFGVCLESC